MSIIRILIQILLLNGVIIIGLWGMPVMVIIGAALGIVVGDVNLAFIFPLSWMGLMFGIIPYFMLKLPIMKMKKEEVREAVLRQHKKLA